MSRAFGWCVVMSAMTAAAAFGQAKKPAGPVVPAALEPLGAKVGGHYAFKGVTLSFKADAPLTEEQWAAVESVKVSNVSANGKGIDNAAVARLAKLPLEGLSIDGGSFTDAGWASFKEMPRLQKLSISHTVKLTGEGAAGLANHPSLTSFGIGGTTFGAAGMPAIATIKQLKTLSLQHAAVTDDCVTPLKNHPSLESLRPQPARDSRRHGRLAARDRHAEGTAGAQHHHDRPHLRRRDEPA